MKRRTFIQRVAAVAAVFGTDAAAPRPEPEMFMAIDSAAPKGAETAIVYRCASTDELFAAHAIENIQRRTYAVMKGLA